MRRLRCRIFGHAWMLTYVRNRRGESGNAERYCTRCNVHQSVNWLGDKAPDWV